MSGSREEQEMTVGAAALIQNLQDELFSMRELIQRQQQEIAQLQASKSSDSNDSDARPVVKTVQAPAARVPQITPYSGKFSQQTSTSVKSFIYNVRKVGQLSNMDEAGILRYAECYLQERAATWMMSLEDAGTLPTTVSELQEGMIKEFVPPDEKSQAKTRLMKIKMTEKMDGYISIFRNLVDLCRTPLSEAYMCFFNGLPDAFKEEFTIKYPTAEQASLQDVYEHARTIETTMQWNSKQGRRRSEPSSKDLGDKGGSRKPNRSDTPFQNGKGKPKDKDALFWGPSQQGERNLYRRDARCYDCGAKYTPSHTCDEVAKKGNSDERHTDSAPKA